MKILVIAAHPDLSASRINKAWIRQLERQDGVTVHRLYDEYPDETIDIAREQALLEEHERIVFQFPLYWYSTPPLLKKWFDVVLAHGWAYGPGGDKLQGKELGVAVSAHGTAASYRPDGANGFTLREFLRPIEGLANYVKAVYLPLFSLCDTGHVTDEQLEMSAAEYAAHLAVAKPIHRRLRLPDGPIDFCSASFVIGDIGVLNGHNTTVVFH